MMAALAATAIFTTSCSDDEVTRGVAKTGTPINFSASTRSMSTRTAYGTALNGGKWDINWVNGDQVTVFCPEASTEVDGVTKSNSSDFTISSMASATDKTVYGVEGGQLYWGEYDAHHFFEVYPSNRFEKMTAESGAEDIILSANLPSTQYATLQPDGHYADMSAALMVGKTTVNRTSAPTPVVLPFAAITTAVDIEVSAAAETDYTVKSLSISNTADDVDYTPLAGEFTYNTATGVFESNDQSEAYNVQVEFPAQKLMHGTDQSLKVTVFLRGDFTKSIKVTVNTDIPNPRNAGAILPVSISKSGTTANLLAPLTRNHINLGAAPDPSTPEEGEDIDPVKPMSGEWWVSHVPSATYVSQMSLPGVYDACSFLPEQRPEDQAQDDLYNNLALAKELADSGMFYVQMKEYLNHGNRVFDFKPTCVDKGNGQFDWICERFLKDGESYRSIEFQKMVRAADDWLKAHTTEFIIFVMSDYSWEKTTPYKQQVSNMLRKIIPARRLLESFDANLSVADARGKILVINASLCDSPIGVEVTNWIMNNTPTYSNGKYESGVTGENRKNGHEFTMKSAAGASAGTIWVQDFNNTDNKGDKNVTDKQSFITYSLNAAKTNTGTLEKWYYTCLPLRRVSQGEITGYGDYEPRLIPYTAEIVNGLSNSGTYQNCGIIMRAHSCSKISGSSVTALNGETLEDIIWQNNYKANGPQRAPSGH